MLLDADRRMLLCRELRQARLRAGLRQVDVSQKLGRPQSFIAKIESGERSIDLIETLSVCRVIGLDPHALIDLIL
jgi:transcriptional regulator with XRE-family HTH domain